MSQINPFVGIVAGGTQVAARQAAERGRQVRRAQNVGKNAGLQGDTLEHQVESADALHAPDGRDANHPDQKKKGHKPEEEDGGEEHLDLTA